MCIKYGCPCAIQLSFILGPAYLKLPIAGTINAMISRLRRNMAMRATMLMLCGVLGGGCSSLISDMSSNLTSAMLGHDDLDTVRDAAPAYLLMMDGLLEDDPDDVPLLTASARLYSAYAGVFVADPARVQRLTSRALAHAMHAACLEYEEACNIRNQAFATLAPLLAELDKDDVPVFYTLGSTWAGWIQAHSENWNAVAELPRVTAIMQRVIELDEGYNHGNAHLYIGITETLLPPALGGKAEQARKHFERAIRLSAGKNLMAKVIYAQRYARLVFNRKLHDRLLHEVLDADPAAGDLTLTNMLAQKLAKELLASADDYF